MEINSIRVETSSLCSAGCGGVLEKAFFPQNENELTQIAHRYRREDFLILGGMTNTLVLDGFDGVAIFSDLCKGVSIDGNHITARSGETMAHVCAMAQYAGLSGLENLFGLPGTIGGALSGNSGCFGTQISDLVDSVVIFKLDALETELLTRDEIAFGYRYCNLRKDKDFILSVRLELFPSDPISIAQKMTYARNKRKERQPAGKSLGSFFKQYNGVSAGFYIEQAGLKGYSNGKSKVSEKHAGFLINNGGTAEEYFAFSEFVRKMVMEKTGVQLEREVNIIGEEGRKKYRN